MRKIVKKGNENSSSERGILNEWQEYICYETSELHSLDENTERMVNNRKYSMSPVTVPLLSGGDCFMLWE